MSALTLFIALFLALAVANPTPSQVFHHLLENNLVQPTHYYDESGNINGTYFSVDEQVEAHAYQALGGSYSHSKNEKRSVNSMTCYCSGSWSPSETLSGAVPTICAHYNLNLHNNQAQYFATGSNYNNVANDRMKIVTTLKFNTPIGISVNTCKDWFRRNIFFGGCPTNNEGAGSCGSGSHPCHGCTGAYSDTRGGIYRTSENGASAEVSVDPTTDNCNC